MVAHKLTGDDRLESRRRKASSGDLHARFRYTQRNHAPSGGGSVAANVRTDRFEGENRGSRPGDDCRVARTAQPINERERCFHRSSAMLLVQAVAGRLHEEGMQVRLGAQFASR